MNVKTLRMSSPSYLSIPWVDQISNFRDGNPQVACNDLTKNNIHLKEKTHVWLWTN
jgi:hypothetical protein